MKNMLQPVVFGSMVVPMAMAIGYASNLGSGVDQLPGCEVEINEARAVKGTGVCGSFNNLRCWGHECPGYSAAHGAFHCSAHGTDGCSDNCRGPLLGAPCDSGGT